MAVKDGNTVRVHYTGTFPTERGIRFFRERRAAGIYHWRRSLIPGFEDARTQCGRPFPRLPFPPMRAYGEHLEELLMKCP